MSDNVAVLCTRNGEGFLVLKNSITSFKDADLGLGGRASSLNISFADVESQDVIVESRNYDPEDIVFDSELRGHTIRLDENTNNILASAQNRYGGKFRAVIREFETQTGNIVGDPLYFQANVEGRFEKMLPHVASEPQKVELSSQPKSAAEDKEESAADVKTAEQTAAVSKEMSLKDRILKSPLPFAIAGLILLLLLLFIGYKFLSGDDSVKTAPPAVVENTQTADDKAKQEDPEAAKSSEDEKATEASEKEENTANAEDNVKSDESAVSETADDETSKSPLNEGTAASVNTQTADSQNETLSSPLADTEAAASSGKAAACVLDSRSDAEIIKSCLESKPDAGALLALSKEAFARNRCDMGKRILSSYGRRDAKVALAYAHYLDENSSENSSCQSKDKKQAIYWYEKAVELGDKSDETSKSLLKLKE